MRRGILTILALTAGCARPSEVRKSNFLEEEIAVVCNPAGGFANLSPFELQVYYRLMNLYHKPYRFDSSHVLTWKTLVMDQEADIYGRICAAQFLLDDDAEARKFLSRLARSDNLRHRYNAAEAVKWYMERDRSKTWAVDLLIQLLADGVLDGSGVMQSPEGDFPRGDRNDIMSTPLDGICWAFGFMKEARAGPALISVLERKPLTSGAAFALGEIGDERAAPVLLEVLKQHPYDRFVVSALGDLKYVEAVSMLISGLDKDRWIFEMEALLEALRRIGDRRAVPAIKKFLDGVAGERSGAVARRVLAQLESDDAVADLLRLLQQESYEPERSDIISALTRYPDARVVAKMRKMARDSDSAFMRREAISALGLLKTRDSLLELANLLKLQFPNDLKAEWGWKIPPQFSVYFPEFVLETLRTATGQSFFGDLGKWVEWIEKNVRR